MRKMKILIADDHKVVRDGVKYILKFQDNFEADIHEAEDGEEALEMASHFKYNVIIMDINMPYMSGIEATRRIMNMDSKNKILALSMFDEEAHISKMIEAGALGYVLKNSGAEELLSAIKRVSKSQKYISSDVTLKLSAQEKARSKNPHDHLPITKRELEILTLIANEYTNAEIAEKLCLSKRTVDSHRTNILNKLPAKNTVGLIRYAVDNKII